MMACTTSDLQFWIVVFTFCIWTGSLFLKKNRMVIKCSIILSKFNVVFKSEFHAINMIIFLYCFQLPLLFCFLCLFACFILLFLFAFYVNSSVFLKKERKFKSEVHCCCSCLAKKLFNIMPNHCCAFYCI